MMGNHIVISAPYTERITDVIDLNQIEKRRKSRRKRVSRRMARKYPLFALEFMKEEFPNIDYDTWEQDVVTKKPSRAKRKGKSQLKRQGRYPLYQRAMSQYRLTKEQKYLEEAQSVRNRMFRDFEFVFTLGKERRTYRLPSTASLRHVDRIKSIRGYKSWKEMEEMWDELSKYEHLT